MDRKIIYIIIALGLFLRFYRIEENFIFSGEVGHNLLAIADAYMTRSVPLIGPPTSHEWMYFGPLFYWLYGPILIVSRFNPLSHAYFGAMGSLLVLILHYGVIRKFFNERVAIISTLLISVSPLFLEFSRAGRFFSFVTVLVYPFLFFLYEIVKGKKKYMFWLFFVYGSMFSFHFTPLMLFPFMLTVFFLRKVKFTRKEIRNGIVGFLLPILPFLFYDATNGLNMIRNMLLWIPYRVAGFFGLYPKNTVSQTVVENNVGSLFNFITSSFIPEQYTALGFFIFTVLAMYVFYLIYKTFRKKSLSLPIQILLLWFGWGYLAVFIHGSPPIHYFVPLLPIPVLLFSTLLDSFPKTKAWGVISLFLVLGVVVINVQYLISSQWYYLPEGRATKEPFYVPYQLQRKVAQSISNDASGKRYELHRVGPDDQFEDDYAQNYIYLLWLFGNKPVKTADIVYTIYDGQDSRIKNLDGTSVYDISNITVVKEIKGRKL